MKISIILTLLFISYNTIAQDSDCNKIFFKEKKSSKKSTAFSGNNSLKTKYCTIYSDGKRQLLISFLKNETENSLVINNWYYGSDGLKRRFVIGKNIKIAFVFEDSSIDIIEFETNEQESSESTSTLRKSFNYYSLSEEFLKKLKEKKIVKVELKNPLGSSNESDVKDSSISSKQGDKIKRYASCFSSKI